MATELRSQRRRHLLVGGTLLATGRWGWSAPVAPRLAASWQEADGNHRLGILDLSGDTARVLARLDLPSRAHEVCVLPGGVVLAVARRPGDWMLRWDWRSGRHAWTWAEPERVFTGHALHDAHRGRIYTAEMRLESGAGVIGVRRADSLALLAEWETHGRDPHELAFFRGQLLVANGGIETRPETGRAKLSLDTMDSSLALLDGQGRLAGQWQLADRRLSLRHLAVMPGPEGGRVGIAMQAEHDDPAARSRAPLLALFDGERLRACGASAGLAGYAGDISVLGPHFVVSATRGDCLARFDAEGTAVDRWPLRGVCALAGTQSLYAAGTHNLLLGAPQRLRSIPHRLDNHWIEIDAGA